MAKVQGESKLTFLESTSIIIGHGVGSGILSVPFLASRNNWHDIIWIAALAYCMNLLLHFMIAELSLNNNGAQFIKCFENELFVGKLKMACTWLAFGLLGFSVVVNVSGFITGAAAVFSAWFHLPSVVGMLLFYVLAASVVYIGMKLVGICEKIAVISMFGVIGILFIATMFSETTELSTKFYSNNNMLALYSMIAFSLSAVMSVPQVVKGLEGDEKGIRRAIAAGTGLNMGLILLITFMTLLGCPNVTENGALVDLSGHLGGWVSTGANGKSVFMNIISNVFGQENVTHLQLVDMYDKFQLIQLESALLNLGEDSGSSLKGGDSELKRLSAGDRVSACYKGKDFISFRSRAKLIFAMNDILFSSAINQGILRRLSTIMFEVHFVDDPKLPEEKKIDRNLEDKLSKELSGIFNWCYEGLVLRQEKGLIK